MCKREEVWKKLARKCPPRVPFCDDRRNIAGQNYFYNQLFVENFQSAVEIFYVAERISHHPGDESSYPKLLDKVRRVAPSPDYLMMMALDLEFCRLQA